ncbi:MAG: Abi family protein [Neisseria sp.]|nr:Abi family protein [Neisseria sp.]
MAEFLKPAKSNVDLLTEWENRGLQIPDLVRAERYLDFIGYYRLSAYTIPFQTTTNSHQFKAGITFDDVLDLYVFDRELRLLIMDAIERIEVAVRSQISNVMALSLDENGQKYGAFWYLEGRHFQQKYEHMKLLFSIEKQLLDERIRLDRDIKNIHKRTKLSDQQKQTLIDNAQKENFLRHYLSNYDLPKLPPCWMIMEMLTWGELSHLYAGLKSNAIKNIIARKLGLNAEILESWLKAFNSIRNFCAHHSRLWNRELGVKIKIPRTSHIKWLSKPTHSRNKPAHSGKIQFERRIYSILVAIQSLLYTISPHSSWAHRLKTLMDKYPKVTKYNMGMPIDWEKDPFWLDALK